MGPMARRYDRIFDELKKIKGFPLATVSDSRMRVGRRQVTIEATEVRRDPIPDSVFAVPAEYKKVDSPFGGGRPPRPAVVNPLVTTEWLAGHLGAPDLRVVDVRWYIDPARRGRDAYAAGHIPGAVFLDMDADLSAPGGGRGRPLRPSSLARLRAGRPRDERGRDRAEHTGRRLRRPGRRHRRAALVPPPGLRARRGGRARRRPHQVDGGGAAAGDGDGHCPRRPRSCRARGGMGPRQGGHGAGEPARPRPRRARGPTLSRRVRPHRSPRRPHPRCAQRPLRGEPHRRSGAGAPPSRRAARALRGAGRARASRPSSTAARA